MSVERSKYQGQIIPTEYGFGQIVSTAPSRDPPRVDPPMTTAAICKAFNWSDEQFEWVRAHPSFPPASFTGAHDLASGIVTRTAVRNAEKVREFVEMGRQVFGGR
jgi:hypothetical protein